MKERARKALKKQHYHKKLLLNFLVGDKLRNKEKLFKILRNETYNKDIVGNHYPNYLLYCSQSK